MNSCSSTFLDTPLGQLLVIAACLAALLAMLVWALRRNRTERISAVVAASLTSLLVAILSVVAVAQGWWASPFFRLPSPVLIAIDLPLSTAGYTLWLGVYRWLRGRTKRALLVYSLSMLAFIPIVLFADRVLVQQGALRMEGGYTVQTDMVVGVVVMNSPAVFYELVLKAAAKWSSGP